jgi:CheY-like chemotaxis protein
LIEDNELHALLFELVLEKRYRVETTTSYAEAWRRLQETPQDSLPHVILIDIRLGGANSGLELVRRVRDDARMRHIAVVALTGYPLQYVAAEAHDAGCVACIEKPFKATDLTREVERVLAVCSLNVA